MFRCNHEVKRDLAGALTPDVIFINIRKARERKLQRKKLLKQTPRTASADRSFLKPCGSNARFLYVPRGWAPDPR